MTVRGLLAQSNCWAVWQSHIAWQSTSLGSLPRRGWPAGRWPTRRRWCGYSVPLRRAGVRDSQRGLHFRDREQRPVARGRAHRAASVCQRHAARCAPIPCRFRPGLPPAVYAARLRAPVINARRGEHRSARREPMGVRKSCCEFAADAERGRPADRCGLGGGLRRACVGHVRGGSSGW